MPCTHVPCRKERVVYAAADGTGATVAIGIGDSMPLTYTPKARAGLAAIVKEIAVGAVVTTGTLSVTNKSYTPAAAPDGTKDWAIFYEYDPSVLSAASTGGT